MKSSALLPVLSLLLGLASASSTAGQEILPGIHVFDGIGASLPKEDLAPIREVIGGASVVGLGESVHTSGGYSRLKYRIFRYMVEEMGFRAFAFESPWERAESVADYVQTCQGSPEAALRGLFGVWQNESVRDLVKWMCIWNRRNPDDRVYFLGFDEQQPDLDHAALKNHLKRFRMPENDPRILGMDTHCSTGRDFSGIAREDYDECLKRLDQLANYFDRREQVIIRRTSAEELEWARLRLLGLRAWQVQLYHLTETDDLMPGIEARDDAMAKIFLKRRELQYPDLKIAIWAHNFHINEKGAVSYGAPTMGDHLAEALGEDYVTLGLVGYWVGIDWPTIGCGFLTGFRPTDSVEVLLHDLGEDYLFVDLDFPGTDTPFLEPGRQYPVNGVRLVPREHYDGLFFLEVSRKMNPLAWPSCQ